VVPNNFKCVCQVGWAGALCDVPIAKVKPNGCSSSPCKNGGSCTPVGSNKFKCTCQVGWAEALCNVPIAKVKTVMKPEMKPEMMPKPVM